MGKRELKVTAGVANKSKKSKVTAVFFTFFYKGDGGGDCIEK